MQCKDLFETCQLDTARPHVCRMSAAAQTDPPHPPHPLLHHHVDNLVVTTSACLKEGGPAVGVPD
jgi:hypothetical protein